MGSPQVTFPLATETCHLILFRALPLPSFTIMLQLGSAQTRQSSSLLGPLPGDKFLKRQGVSVADLFN